MEMEAPFTVFEELDVPVIDANTPQAVLDSMSDKATITLGVGSGRLGLDWSNGISR